MQHHSRLLHKYAALILSLVGLALATSGAVSTYFSYLEIRSGILALESEKAESAAGRIDQFVREIQSQIGWTTLPQIGKTASAAEMRKLDFLKLLRQVAAITEVVEIDAAGREQIRLSRLATDAIGTGENRSEDPRYLRTRNGETYFGPIYFRKETEPYMSIAMRSAGGGVVAVEVNLKFIWDVVSQIRIGKSGYAYVVDPKGKLIAHPDISLVLQQTDLSRLAHVAAVMGDASAPAGTFGEAHDRLDKPVLSAYSKIERLGWLVFVEQPKQEAYEPIYASLMRNGVLLLGALILAMLASLVLARRMVHPINALRETAAAIGTGDLGRRIEINTDDELQELADQFNDMAAQLNEAYAGLEAKVAERTEQLAASEARTKELLHNILPASVAADLAESGHAKPVEIKSATIFFSDFSGFTQVASSMPAERMVAELNEIFSAFDDICSKHGIEKIKTIGDAYMAASGVPLPFPDHAQRAVRVGLAMYAFLAERNKGAAFKWNLRVGIHSGPVVAGVVGKHKYAFDVWGDTVNIASRMESAGEIGRVNISAYTYDLIRNDFACEYRGKVAAKGKGELDMYFVTPP